MAKIIRLHHRDTGDLLLVSMGQVTFIEQIEDAFSRIWFVSDEGNSIEVREDIDEVAGLLSSIP